MTRFRIVTLTSSVALAAGVTVAIAGIPFGGDDQGTIPSDAPNRPVTKCESGVASDTPRLTRPGSPLRHAHLQSSSTSAHA